LRSAQIAPFLDRLAAPSDGIWFRLAEALGAGDRLKRAEKIGAGLVQRRTTAMARLDSLLEILGRGWTGALETRGSPRSCIPTAVPNRISGRKLCSGPWGTQSPEPAGVATTPHADTTRSMNRSVEPYSFSA